MRRRLLVAITAAALAAAVFLRLAPLSVAGQGSEPAPAAATEAGALKVSWGDPDLQGIWTDIHQTPLQRSREYGTREFLTDEERAAQDERRRAAPNLDSRVAPRGSEQDLTGAYNAVFQGDPKPRGRRTSLIVDPPDGRIPPLTEEARKRNAAMREFELALAQATDTCKNKLSACAGGTYGPPSPRRAEVPPSYLVTSAVNRADGPEDRDLRERCMLGGLPDFGAYLRIIQSPGSVAVAYDTGQGQAWQRVIPITANPHAPPHVRQWRGDSRGRWDGQTLVVDVTNFTPKTDFQSSRENLHLVERWTRLDANTLEYVVTIEDPTTWTRPWTIKQELTRQDDRANRIYYEPRCHEGNYGLIGSFIGARADEKAFAEGRGPNPATRCISIAACGYPCRE